MCLIIVMSKTRGSFAKLQHSKSDHWAVCALRACWNAVLKALDVPCQDSSGVTPTSVHGGHGHV